MVEKFLLFRYPLECYGTAYSTKDYFFDFCQKHFSLTFSKLRYRYSSYCCVSYWLLDVCGVGMRGPNPPPNRYPFQISGFNQNWASEPGRVEYFNHLLKTGMLRRIQNACARCEVHFFNYSYAYVVKCYQGAITMEHALLNFKLRQWLLPVLI